MRLLAGIIGEAIPIVIGVVFVCVIIIPESSVTSILMYMFMYMVVGIFAVTMIILLAWLSFLCADLATDLYDEYHDKHTR